MSGSDASQISRRDFIKAMTALVSGVIGTLIGLPSVVYLLSPAMKSDSGNQILLSLGPLKNYPIGIPTRFEFTQTRVNGWERTATNYGLYVVKKSKSNVRVFSDVCTHLGCRVSWHADQAHYVSPCHDGHFDIVGNVISGPPPRPLDEFVIQIEDGELFVKLPPIRREA
jgi:menaquinol-cytochrome c reductase iron-sulfur subunit